MTGLAPGELQFNIRAWTKDFGDWVAARTELAMKIRDGLAEAGIEIPKPQRELVIHGLPSQAAPGSSAQPFLFPERSRRLLASSLSGFFDARRRGQTAGCVQALR